MSEDTLPHATSAPDELQKEAGAAIDEMRKSEQKDELGRINWAAVSQKMSDWWKEKGYSYP